MKHSVRYPSFISVSATSTWIAIWGVEGGSILLKLSMMRLRGRMYLPSTSRVGLFLKPVDRSWRWPRARLWTFERWIGLRYCNSRSVPWRKHLLGQLFVCKQWVFQVGVDFEGSAVFCPMTLVFSLDLVLWAVTPYEIDLHASRISHAMSVFLLPWTLSSRDSVEEGEMYWYSWRF